MFVSFRMLCGRGLSFRRRFNRVQRLCQYADSEAQGANMGAKLAFFCEMTKHFCQIGKIIWQIAD